MRIFIYSLFLFLSVFVSTRSFSQLVVSVNQPASVLASTLAGPGVVILNPSLTCDSSVAEGTFTVTGTLLAMNSGILLTNGHAAAASGAYCPPPGCASFNLSYPGDPALAPYVPTGVNTYDACILQFDIVASGDSVGFNYQFGSQEYYSAVCSRYTDVFAFFISGPGITGTPDMALVPGTNIPVEINSVNDGIPGSSSPGTTAYCTALGAGSPFTAYYLANSGASLALLGYKGYTTKLRASYPVTPCDTYHLKLSIADAGNGIYDSGVFLEANSLTTNTYGFNHSTSIGTTVAGVPNTIVKGCAPGTVNITAAHANTTPTMLNISFGGTAVNGVDVATIPDTVTLPADSTSVGISVQGIPTPVGGGKVLTIYLNGSCGLLDSISMNILDTPTAAILTPDTAVCAGASFPILVSGTAGLSYTWAPPAGLSSTTVMDPACTPVAPSTTYTMSATIPGAGCPDIVRTITVTEGSTTVTILSNDTTICNGASVSLNAVDTNAASFSWSPTVGLSNPSIADPVAMPAATTTYTLTAATPGGYCTSSAEVTITVIDPKVFLLTPDTTVCFGQPIYIRVNGNLGFTYSWSPADGLSNPSAIEPVATPDSTTTYTLITTYPGTACTDTVSFTATILELPVTAAYQIDGCYGRLDLMSAPAGSGYSYLWNGPAGFSDSVQNPSFLNPDTANGGTYTVSVHDASNGCTEQASVNVYIQPLSARQLTNVTADQTISYGSTAQLNVDNALYFWWMPNDGTISNRNINDPVVNPTQTTTYTAYGIDSMGCIDSAKITVYVTTDSIIIPSAFTPNGDGLNDVFRPLNMRYMKMELFSVYNRWGQQVFTTNSNEIGWDGKFNGVPQDMGVYNYVVIVSLNDGSNQTYKGNVTLIR